MHPEIKRFWELSGHRVLADNYITSSRDDIVCIRTLIPSTQYVYTGDFRRASPIAIIYEDNRSAKYWLEDFSGPYSEEMMLKIIKLKAFI